MDKHADRLPVTPDAARGERTLVLGPLALYLLLLLPLLQAFAASVLITYSPALILAWVMVRPGSRIVSLMLWFRCNQRFDGNSSIHEDAPLMVSIGEQPKSSGANISSANSASTPPSMRYAQLDGELRRDIKPFAALTILFQQPMGIRLELA
jgi:hypothetical protein